MIEVVRPGPLATIQDRGRRGWAHLAVSPSGAFDLPALELGNRLVGNTEVAAGIEVTFGGLELRAQAERLVVAVTGAPVAVAVDGTAQGMGHPIVVRPGRALVLGQPRSGLRTYVAVRGGIDVPAVLGSRSSDLLGGVGPVPLVAGDRLPVGAEPGTLPFAGQAPLAEPATALVLRIHPGPRQDWFVPDALAQLTGRWWQVRPESDRVGVRLDGPPLRRLRTEELPSEGMVEGAVQVPPDGRPVVFGPDHPTTGGYPVLAVLASGQGGALAQLRPGDRVRFVTSGPVRAGR